MNTEIIFLIDKSGSMSNLTKETIQGFNGFVESQKDDTKTTLTTVLFDSTWRVLHDGIDVYEVKPMTTEDYRAGGYTAMLDAIGDTINRVQDRHDELGEGKPDNVLFVITTDGEENSSRKFTKSQIEKMIKHQTNGHGWEFIFLGANMDAVKEASNIGISSTRAVSYDWTTCGTDALYSTVTAAACATKSCILDSLDLQGTYNSCVGSADAVISSAKAYTDDSITEPELGSIALNDHRGSSALSSLQNGDLSMVSIPGDTPPTPGSLRSLLRNLRVIVWMPGSLVSLAPATFRTIPR